MDSPEFAMYDVPRTIKGRRWLVQPAGVYSLVYCAKAAIQNLFVLKGNPNIEGILLAHSLLVFVF